MKKIAFAIAASILVAGCISTDMGTAPVATAPDAGVNAERGTGSNISRRDRVVTGTADRDEIEKMQRPGGSNQIGKSAGR